MTIIEIFPGKFKIDPETGCWLFLGYTDEKGYGIVRYRFRLYKVHRLSAHLTLGLDISNKSELALHKTTCSNKHCANPEHLYIGNASDNVQDSVKTGGHAWLGHREFCKNGHKLEGDNIYISPSDGRRRCQACRKENQTINRGTTKK